MPTLASNILLFSPFSSSDVHVQTDYYVNFMRTEKFEVLKKAFCKEDFKYHPQCSKYPTLLELRAAYILWWFLL
jgi:hypothetical protein